MPDINTFDVCCFCEIIRLSNSRPSSQGDFYIVRDFFSFVLDCWLVGKLKIKPKNQYLLTLVFELDPLFLKTTFCKLLHIIITQAYGHHCCMAVLIAWSHNYDPLMEAGNGNCPFNYLSKYFVYYIFHNVILQSLQKWNQSPSSLTLLLIYYVIS